METINITITGKEVSYISSYYIANAGEHFATEFIFSFSSDWDVFTKQIVITNPAGEKLAPIPIINNKVELPAQAIRAPGVMKFTVEGLLRDGDMITMVQNSGLEKVYVRTANDSLNGAPVTDYENYVNDCITMTESFENATASATTLAEGEAATVSLTDGALGKEFAFGIPKGDKGDTGEKGDTGTSFIGDTLTQAEYDALSPKDANTYYFIVG